MSIKGRATTMGECFLEDFRMNSRTLYLVTILVGFGAFVNFVVTSPLDISTEASSDITDIMVNCKHSDYRTYIQCLKRYKRQPNDNVEAIGLTQYKYAFFFNKTISRLSSQIV